MTAIISRIQNIDWVGLWIRILFVSTFFMAGIEKLLSEKAPQWFLTQFEKTFLNFSNWALPLQYYSIGFAEVIVAMLFAISIFFRTFSDYFLSGGQTRWLSKKIHIKFT